jgi:biotin transport system substrate-specific component
MSTETTDVDLVEKEMARNIARAALVAALTGAFAFVSFPNPLSSVPVTLQVLGVFLAGILLGPVWGSLSLCLYLLAGAIGAPVFTGGTSGLGVLLGPTAGYLWSYPLAAFAIGVVVHGGFSLRNLARIHLSRLVAGMVLGTAIIYALGTVGFAIVQGVGLWKAFLVSAVVFIPAEAMKIAAAVGIVRSDEIMAT